MHWNIVLLKFWMFYSIQNFAERKTYWHQPPVQDLWKITLPISRRFIVSKKIVFILLTNPASHTDIKVYTTSAEAWNQILIVNLARGKMSGKFGKSIKLINSFQKLNKQNRSSEFVWRINFQEQKLERISLERKLFKNWLHWIVFF